jgi:hypothetical protein
MIARIVERQSVIQAIQLGNPGLRPCLNNKMQTPGIINYSTLYLDTHKIVLPSEIGKRQQ